MPKTNLFARRGIYAAVPVSILMAKDIKPRSLRVYIALCSFEGSNPRCWPSRAAIAERAGIHPSHVPPALANLIEAGWLEREARLGASSIYRTLVPVKLAKGSRFRGIPVSNLDTPPVSKSGTRKRSWEKLAAGARHQKRATALKPLAGEKSERVARRAPDGASAPLGKRTTLHPDAGTKLDTEARGGGEGRVAAEDAEAPVDPEVGLRYLAEIREKLAAKGKGRRP